MNTKIKSTKLHQWIGGLSACLVMLGGVNLHAQTNAAIPQQQALPEPEVLEEGPIHEAFAEPLSLEVGELEVVPQLPPEPIQELPPDERPEGENVEWLPGYWAWSPDKENFVWVSGLWRNVPPQREWVPGHWQEVEGGYAWVSGFWSDGPLEQVQYLPEPPATLETGPSSPAPGENYLWAPGCWQWHNTNYAWQPGYWYQANPNWVWVPAHYRFSPLGFVHVGGYWDYPLYRRGMLFAPVWWGGGFHPLGGWGGHWWQPRSVINVNFLWGNMFVHSGFNRFWYGPRWHGNVPRGFHHWGHNYDRWGRGRGMHRSYDPLWAHRQWNERQGRAPDGRSRANWESQVGRYTRDGGDRGRSRLISSVDDFRRDQGSSYRTRSLDQSEVNAYRDRAERYRESSNRRASVDRTAVAEGRERSVGRVVREGDGTRTWSGDRSQSQRGGTARSGDTRTRSDWSGGAGRSDIRSRADASGEIRRGQSEGARTDIRSRAEGTARTGPADRQRSGTERTVTDRPASSWSRGDTSAAGRTDIRTRAEAAQPRAVDRTTGRAQQGASRVQQGAVDRGGQIRRSTEARPTPSAQQRVMRAETPSARQGSATPSRTDAFRQRSPAADQAGRSFTPRSSGGPSQSIQRSAPSVQRSSPSIQRSSPSIQRSSPSIRSAPASRGAPSMRSAPSSRSAPSMRSAPSSRSGGGAMRSGGGSSRGGGSAMRSGGGGGGGSAMRSGGGGGRGGSAARGGGGGRGGGRGR